VRSIFIQITDRNRQLHGNAKAAITIGTRVFDSLIRHIAKLLLGPATLY